MVLFTYFTTRDDFILYFVLVRRFHQPDVAEVVRRRIPLGLELFILNLSPSFDPWNSWSFVVEGFSLSGKLRLKE